MSDRDDRTKQMRNLAKDRSRDVLMSAYLKWAADEIDHLRQWQKDACRVLRLNWRDEFDKEMSTEDLLRRAGITL